MNVRLRALLGMSLPVALLLLGCALPDFGKGGGGGDFSGGPGLGSDTGNPTGTPFSWPAPIVVSSAIIGAVTGDVDQVVGFGTYVNAYVPLTNTSAGTVSFTVPGGLLFVSSSVETQNGLLIQEDVIVIPPQTTYYVMFDLLCLNAHRGASGEIDTYTVGPVTNDPELLEIVSILAGKDLIGDSFVIQDAVWEVTDYSGTLTDDERSALQGL